jgi:UDP-2,3-diacylglucosamine pyrophosphatase LpxH
MLVVVSDLHFEEEASDVIPGDGTHPPVAFSRNLPGRAYQSFVAHLASEAQRNGAKRLDLVFAGDIFDIHRTSLWVVDSEKRVRPYANTSEVDEDIEDRVLKILKAIQTEPGVVKALEVFQMLGEGRYFDRGDRDFPVPVSLHYIPGNHDRLANATGLIRREVRKALGIQPSDRPFGHVLTFEREGAVIRHGHEYDRHNFSFDYADEESIPLEIPQTLYDEAPFGDFATVDIASQIPHLFRQHHSDERILSEPMLRKVYLRLLEFDDLRPQMAMLNFLLHMPKAQVDPATVWQSIVPILENLLEELYIDPFLLKWLDRMDKKWQLDAIDAIQTSLALKSWRLAGIPLGLAQFISKAAIDSISDAPGARELSAREEVIQRGDYRFVIAGHTHTPATELIASDGHGERYYVDTGTWRNRIPATPDFKAFGRLKTLTYAIIYGPDEDMGDSSRNGKLASIDFWSGITQRWYTEPE